MSLPQDRDTGPDDPEVGRSAVSTAGVASGARWVVAGRAVTQASRFVVSILLARLLDPQAFGVVAVAMTTILALEVLKDLGTGSALIQRPSVDQRLLSSVFHLNTAVGAACAAGMAVWAPQIAQAFDSPESTSVVRALSVVLFVGGLVQTHHAVMRRRMNFPAVAAVEMTGAGVNGVVSIALALGGAGVWSLVWGNIAGVIAGTVVAWVRSGWLPSAQFSIASLREIAGFSLHTAAFNATTFALQNTDKVLVSRMLGAGPLGVYTLGQRTIAYPIESISGVLMTVLFPAFARIQDDHAALRRGYLRALGAIAFVTMPVMVGVAVLAEPLVATALGAKWSDLVPLLWFMAPAGVIAALLSAVTSLYSTQGRADHLFRWGVASGIATLAAFAVGLRWGLPGLAVAYLVVMLLQAPVGFAFALRLIDMRLRTLARALAPYAGMTLVMALLAWGAAAVVRQAGASEPVQLMAGVVVGSVAYLGLAVWRRPPAYRDVRTLLDVRRGRGT